jgi:hypothetical protein
MLVLLIYENVGRDIPQEFQMYEGVGEGNRTGSAGLNGIHEMIQGVLGLLYM